MKKTVLILALFLSLLGLTGCREASFVGSSVATDDSWTLTFSALSMTRTATLHLDAGDELAVAVALTAGEADASVALDGESVWTGDKAENAAFTVTVPTSGEYKLTVTGRKAAGSFTFTRVQ